MLAFVGIPFAIYVIATGLIVAGAILTRKKKRETPDDFSGSTATMGAYTALVIGRARVTPVFLHLEDATTGSTVLERAVHALCVGPASQLTAVYQNGEEIWRGPVNPQSHPSGSLVASLPNHGSFYVYWGFRDDPIIPNLTVPSRMPLVMKILWDPKNLGLSRSWPRLEYEVSCPCYSQISNTPSELPLEGDDSLPSFQTWRDSISGSGYVPTGRSANDRLVFDVWGYRAATRELIVLDKFRFGNPVVMSQDLFLDNAYPDGGIVKVFTYNGSVVVFEGTSHNDALSSLLPNGEWKYFWVVRSYVSLDQVQHTVGATVYLTFRTLRIVLGSEVNPALLKNLQSSNPSFVASLHDAVGYASPVSITDTDGINPVHMIDQLLFAKFPYGTGRDRSLFDSRSIEAVASLVHTEKIRGGISIEDGETAESVLAPLLQDMGIMIPWDVEVGKYVFRAVRHEIASIDLPRDVILDIPEMVSINGDQPVDVVAFTYKDRTRNYREVPVKAVDTGQVSEFEYFRVQKHNIEVTQDRDSVTRIVPRRQQEVLTNLSSLEWKMNHGCQLAMPGSKFKASAVEGTGMQFLITNVQRYIDSSKVETDTVIDSYNPPVLGEGDEVGGIDTTPQVDELAPAPRSAAPADPLTDFTAIETDDGVLFLASRDNVRTNTLKVWASRDGLSFEDIGFGTLSTRGILDVGLSAGKGVDEGPLAFTADFDVDAAGIEDLTLDPDSWRAGRQIAVIGDEICFLRAGFPSSLEGLLRGRLGTQAQAHAVGTPVFIFKAFNAQAIKSQLFAPGKDVHYKAQAVAQKQASDLSLVVEKVLSVRGFPAYPRKVSALRTSTFNPSYSSSGDLTVRWCYRTSSESFSGAGSQPFGLGVVGSSPVEGYFKLTILNNLDVFVAELTSTSPQIVLTNAYRDGLSLDALPNWKLVVEHINGSLISDPSTITLVPA